MSLRAQIIQSLETKASLKQEIYRNTQTHFNELCFISKSLIDEILPIIEAKDPSVELDYSEQGTYEVQLKIAGDSIIINMHTNVFNFEDAHPLHKTTYIQEDKTRVYCGMIEIYNFLSDSFKYDRMSDTGYLIARIFINKDNHFFVEGTRQLGFLYNDFGTQILDEKQLTAIIEAAIMYSIDFDLWVPPFAQVQQLSVGHLIQKNGTTPQKTSKRMGYDLSDMVEA
jgi:hypothetical protein